MSDEHAKRDLYFAEKLKKPDHLKQLEGKEPTLWQLTEDLKDAYFKALKKHDDELKKQTSIANDKTLKELKTSEQRSVKRIFI